MAGGAGNCSHSSCAHAADQWQWCCVEAKPPPKLGGHSPMMAPRLLLLPLAVEGAGMEGTAVYVAGAGAEAGAGTGLAGGSCSRAEMASQVLQRNKRAVQGSNQPTGQSISLPAKLKTRSWGKPPPALRISAVGTHPGTGAAAGGSSIAAGAGAGARARAAAAAASKSSCGLGGRPYV